MAECEKCEGTGTYCSGCHNRGFQRRFLFTKETCEDCDGDPVMGSSAKPVVATEVGTCAVVAFSSIREAHPVDTKI